jgi:hypothetical protein
MSIELDISDKRHSQSIGLSDDEIKRIKRITNNAMLTRAVRDMLYILEDIQAADPEAIVTLDRIK